MRRDKVPKMEGDIRCPTGEARITPPFDLPCSAIIHAVGPVFDVKMPQQSRDLLKKWLSFAFEN
jgi:O-acetyl-ADP-ribose deacetylase (regulator of RNase III)